MARIFTDTDSMREVAEDFQGIINDFEQLSEKLKVLINELEPQWQGNAGRDYLNGLKNRLADMNNVISALQSMKTTADNRIRDAFSIDKNAADNIAGSFNNLGEVFNSLRAAIDFLHW